VRLSYEMVQNSPSLRKTASPLGISASRALYDLDLATAWVDFEAYARILSTITYSINRVPAPCER